MGKDPAMPFYCNDWFSSPRVIAMSPAEELCFLRLLGFMWMSGDCTLADSPAYLATLGRCDEQTARTVVEHVFLPVPNKPGFITNDRLNALWQERLNFREQRRRAGIKSGLARSKGNERSLNTCSSPLERKGNSSSSSSNSSSCTNVQEHTNVGNAKSKRQKGSYPAHFESWWQTYPKSRRVAKKKTLNAWVQAGKRLREEHDWSSEKAVAYLQERVEAYAASPAGKREKYVPHSHRWLTQGRYDDSDDAWSNLDETNTNQQGGRYRTGEYDGQDRHWRPPEDSDVGP